MHLIKCDNEHIYDSDKFRSCPHCSKISLGIGQADAGAMQQANVDTKSPEENEQQQYQKIGLQRVMGVVICLSGEMAGEGFLLREGNNHIGRASNMDIALTREISISRKKHATIHCDAETGECELLVNESDSEVRCNGNVVLGQCALQGENEIQIGKCCLKVVTVPNIWKV